jgi:hypothetical protein
MNMKRVSIGSIVGLVAIYVLGIVFWEMLFADFFAANVGSAEGVDRAEQIIWAGALGSLFYACLITLMMEARGSASLIDGAKTGAIVGFLLWGTADFILFANTNLTNFNGTIADAVVEGVRGGLVGAIIAMVLSKVGD